MQSHGQKRTPEEFKEIRKEWKQRKKEEEAQRKAEEERQRTAAAAGGGGPDQGPDGTPTPSYPGSRAVQLPPIGYQPTQYPAPPSGAVAQQGLADYGTSHMYSSYQPHSPYGQPSQSMYTQ
ncbi:C2H2 finger domain transcription factor con7, partial [Claviceps pusilla]